MTQEKTNDHDIAIVGIGCRFPDAPDADAFWQNIEDGTASFTPVPKDRWDHDAVFSKNGRDVDKTWTPHGAFIDDIRSFSPLHYGIAPRRLEVMDPQHRLLIDTVRESIQDAGYELQGLPKARTGVYFGLSVSEYKNIMTSRLRASQLANGDFGPAVGDAAARTALLRTAENVSPTRAFSIAGVLTNMAAASVAQVFDLRGPAFSIDAACASASVATHDAVMMLRAGAIDVGLAGGAYLNLTPDNLIGFTRVGAISKTGYCRPFEARADGFVQGDGVGVVVLKRLQDAVRDDDRIYAVIRGSALNNDGKSDGPMTPRVGGQLDVLRAAYQDAQVNAAEMTYFEGHGTATTVGDPVEVEALSTLLQECGASDKKPLGSVKANIGHTMSAAGIAGLIKAAKLIERRRLPPQPDFQNTHPSLGSSNQGLRFLNQEETPADGKIRVGVSSFGFGGTNSHVVLESPDAPRNQEQDGWADAVILSAPTPELLQGHLEALAKHLRTREPALKDVVHTLNTRRQLARYRVIVDAPDLAGLIESLDKAVPAVCEGAWPKKVGRSVSFVDRGESPAPKLAFMFAGQGAQKPHLLGDIRSRFPQYGEAFADTVSEADELLVKGLAEYLYPDTLEGAEEALRATEICQPAMAAAGLSLGRLLHEFGVQADVSLGHSLGEFVALAHAGVFDAPEAVRLVAQRGRAMRNLPLEDTGTMAAVMADAKVVAPLIVDLDGVRIANINRPGQVTVSGETAAVATAVERLKAAGLRTEMLSVSHAFHSDLLSGIRPTMRSILDDATLSTPEHFVASCVCEHPHTEDLDQTREILLDHATAPVDFVRCLNQAYEAGARLFLQVGSGSMLAAFAKATFKDADVETIAVSPQEQDRTLGFCRALLELRARGIQVDLARLFAGRGRPVSLPATPLDRQDYWVVREDAQPLPKQSYQADEPQFGTLKADTPKRAQTTMHPENNELVGLFQAQAEILKKHAEIIAAQNRVLLGEESQVPAGITDSPGPAKAPEPDLTPAVVTVAPTIEKSQAPAANIEPDKIRASIMDIVAEVSAFPKDSLREEQTLVDDLGFDSLMVADLGAALDKQYPELGGLPQSLFSTRTTVQNLTDHIEGTLTTPEDEQSDSRPLLAYQPVPMVTERPTISARKLEGERWIVTIEEGGRVPARLSEAMTLRGIRGFVVRLGGEGSPSLAEGTETVWPNDDMSGLANACGEADVHVHIAGHHKPANGHFHNPVRQLHALVQELSASQRIVVTQMGGQLGLSSCADLTRNLMQAAQAGYAKALGRERKTESVRVVDLGSGLSDNAFTGFLLDEAACSETTPEVGFDGIHRYTVGFNETERTPLKSAADQVVLITGGTGEIGRLMAAGLLERGTKAVLLIGRRPQSDETHVLLQTLGGEGRTRYASADVCDASALRRIVTDFEAQHGQITTVFHAAGAIDDAAVETLSAERIEAVLRTKVHGLSALRSVLPTAKILAFSSWSARFGNRHQCAYAAANDLLDRMAIADDSGQTLAVDWPPWTTTTMVASIPKTVQAAMRGEGITFVDDVEGKELALDLLNSSTRLAVVARSLPNRLRRLAFTQTLNVERHPYLNDHQLDGRPVLPLASATDMFATLLETLVGQRFCIEGLELIRPVEVSQDTIISVVAETKLTGEISLTLEANGELAYRATGGEPGPVKGVELAGSDEPMPFSVEDFYRDHTFHGPMFQGIKQIARLTADGIEGTVCGADPSSWFVGAIQTDFAQDPRVLDSGFQLAGYWALVRHQLAGYPLGFRRLTRFRGFEKDGVRCRIQLEHADQERFAANLAFEDADGQPIAFVEGLLGRLSDPNGPRAGTEVNASTKAQIPEEHRNIALFPEVEHLGQRLEMANLVGLKNPYFSEHDGIARNRSVIGGVEMLNFSSYNYLGFSGHPQVLEAAQVAIDRYGTSVSASRVASGERPIHRDLEKGIAGHIGVEDAIVFVSGHATNVTTVGHLLGPEDIVFHDALIHDSILQGIKLSGATRRPYAHEDLDALEKVLSDTRHHHRRALIAAEGIYSMDGDICALPRLIDLKRRFGTLLLIDEAHSIGVLGEAGRGVGHHYPGLDPNDVDLWMGTLSKSFASCGGYIAGSAALVRYLKYTAPGFVYSAGLPPPNAAAALKALELMQSRPEVVERLRSRSMFFLKAAKAAGLDTGLAAGAAVIPIIVGNSMDCLRLSEALLARKINVQPIVYPAVEDDAARLRFFISSTHTENELEHTARTVAEELAKVRQPDAMNQRL